MRRRSVLSRKLSVSMVDEAKVVRCLDCFNKVLAKSMYAHIVIQHHRIPREKEVLVQPLPHTLKRLKPHFQRIAAKLLSELREEQRIVKVRGDFVKDMRRVSLQAKRRLRSRKDGQQQ